MPQDCGTERWVNLEGRTDQLLPLAVGPLALLVREDRFDQRPYNAVEALLLIRARDLTDGAKHGSNSEAGALLFGVQHELIHQPLEVHLLTGQMSIDVGAGVSHARRTMCLD